MPFPEPLRADEEGLRGRHPPLFSTVFTYEDADGMLQTPSHTLMGSSALHQVSSRAGREECHFLKRETTTYGGGGGPLSAALCCSRSADVCAIPPTSFPSKVTNMKRLKKRLEKEHGKEKVKGELGCDFYPPTFILPSVSTRTGHSYGTLSHRHFLTRGRPWWDVTAVPLRGSVYSPSVSPLGSVARWLIHAYVRTFRYDCRRNTTCLLKFLSSTRILRG